MYKKLTVSLMIGLLFIVLMTSAFSIHPCPIRNKHCRPIPTPTSTWVTPTAIATPTPRYHCMSLACK